MTAAISPPTVLSSRVLKWSWRSCWRTLRGPHCTLTSTTPRDYVIPALELIDARSHNIDLKPSARAKCSTPFRQRRQRRVILGGRPIKPDELDLRDLRAALSQRRDRRNRRRRRRAESSGQRRV